MQNLKKKFKVHEWMRKPFSRLEKTLRFPQIFWVGISLETKRLFIPWAIFGYLLWLAGINGWIAFILGLIIILIIELFRMYSWYQKDIFPKHNENVNQVKNYFQKRKNYSQVELVNVIEDAVKKSAWSIDHIGYGALASWGWEIIFKLFYPLIVKTDIPHYELLVGFMNKNTEADQMLWKVAQEKDKEKQKKLLRQFLDQFGSKIEDVDLKYPTFREQPVVIESMLKLYKNSPSPQSRLEKAKKRREKAYSQILKNLRIPKLIFDQLLPIVQKNVAMREDRRFYEFEMDYYIRQLILELGQRKNLDPVSIFNLSWKELKHEN